MLSVHEMPNKPIYIAELRALVSNKTILLVQLAYKVPN